MKINHKSLGECNVLVHWNGNKNQIALVSCDKTYRSSSIYNRDFEIVPTKRRNSFEKRKPQYWIIWTSNDLDIETGGTTRMESPRGRMQTQSAATRAFMKITQFADEMTFRKIYRWKE
jgi:hypothetical protein